jgi:transcriptional regulator with XRE-family HTH domain
MRSSKKLSHIDRHIGGRVRVRRRALKMNQTVLATKLDLTFQMVQRYEYGLCRISASTLYAIASALSVPVSYFFDGLSVPPNGATPARTPNLALEHVTRTRDGRDLVRLFVRIDRRELRHAIVNLIRSLAAEDPENLEKF